MASKIVDAEEGRCSSYICSLDACTSCRPSCLDASRRSKRPNHRHGVHQSALWSEFNAPAKHRHWLTPNSDELLVSQNAAPPLGASPANTL